jgi:hypothetical protein
MGSWVPPPLHEPDVTSASPRASAPSARRWVTDARAFAALLAVAVALELWAISSADPDYYLPDPLRIVVVALLLAGLLSGFLPSETARRRTRAGALVLVSVLFALEAHGRFRDAGSGADRIAVSEDVLLRYHYRPGAETRAGPGNGAVVRVNSLGLLDTEHAIPKPADVFRVVVLTGSIANDGAIPFEDRFFRRLERQLEGAAPDGRRIEVINASCEGYNTIQQIRLLELVGLRYQPDLVVVGYMLTSATIQNGAYRRIGNSFFLFRFLPALALARTRSFCSMFEPFHDRYTFELVVRNSFERLALLRQVHGFRTLVAVLPVVEEFDDPICKRLYDKVTGAARAAGHETVRVADAFLGEPAGRFAKPGQRGDVAHPNVEGHSRIGDAIARAARAMLATPAPP